MGTNMVRRLMRAGHQCVVYDLQAETVQTLAKEGAAGTTSLKDFAKKLKSPRVVWMMVPAAVVDPTLKTLVPLLEREDVVIDGGNSYYHDDIRRAAELKPKGIHYVDAGTSGGVWGSERGYCLMIGGDETIVRRIDPIFAALAPNIDEAPRTPGREKLSGTAEHGYLHCGPSGAGHFVKMVHNGIEYGMMASYAEAFDVERSAAEAEARPRLGQSLETVEAVNRAWGDTARDVANRAAGEDAEFEIMAVDADSPQRIVDQITLVFETKRIRHRAFDVVDAALQGAQGAFADRMNPSGVDQLIGAADDLVEHVFQPEIGDQHGNRKTFLSAWKAYRLAAPF